MMQIVYVGCRTTRKRNARGKGLVTYRVEEDGTWTELQTLFVEDNPSYQCLDLTGQFLYSVHGDLSHVSAYRIQEDGTLVHLNTIDIGGKNPVDITIDRNNKNLVVATLQGGTLYTIAREADGSLGEVIATFTYEGKGPDKVSTIHQCLWDRDKKHLIACAQGRINGLGQMRALRYDEQTGRFTETDRFLSRTWDEPRHAAVHPNKRWLYMVEEKGNKVLYFRFDDKTAEYSFDMLPELEPAYAMTVHKSQGSEYRAVVLCLYAGAQMLLTRSVLYTAVTRAKELLIIVGREELIAAMTENDRRQRRYSGLKLRLEGACGE